MSQKKSVISVFCYSDTQIFLHKSFSWCPLSMGKIIKLNFKYRVSQIFFNFWDSLYLDKNFFVGLPIKCPKTLKLNLKLKFGYRVSQEKMQFSAFKCQLIESFWDFESQKLIWWSRVIIKISNDREKMENFLSSFFSKISQGSPLCMSGKKWSKQFISLFFPYSGDTN